MAVEKQEKGNQNHEQQQEKNTLDYAHSGFYCFACGITGGYRLLGKYHCYGGCCEYAADHLRYDLRYDVRALCRCHFACHGKADRDRPALEPDTVYHSREHYPHIDLALHRQPALGT